MNAAWPSPRFALPIGKTRIGVSPSLTVFNASRSTTDGAPGSVGCGGAWLFTRTAATRTGAAAGSTCAAKADELPIGCAGQEIDHSIRAAIAPRNIDARRGIFIGTQGLRVFRKPSEPARPTKNTATELALVRKQELRPSNGSEWEFSSPS